MKRRHFLLEYKFAISYIFNTGLEKLKKKECLKADCM